MSVFDSPERPRTRGGDANRYRDALKKRASAIQVARDLADQEKRLGELILQIDRARSASSHVRWARCLKKLLESSIALRSLESVEFDPRLDRIRGDEIDRVQTMRATSQSQAEKHARLLLQMQSFQRRMDEMPLGSEPPSQAIVDAWLERLDQAADLVAEGRRLRLEHASAEAARGAACELLFGIQEGSLPSKERLEELGEITQRRLNMEALAEAADQRVRIWSAMVPDEPLDSAVLNQSINGMRAWLREGDSSQSKVVFELSTRRRLVIMMGLLLGLGLGVVAFYLDAFVSWLIAYVAPVTLVAGLWVIARGSVPQ